MVGAAGIEPATPTMSTDGPTAIPLIQQQLQFPCNASVAPTFTGMCAKGAPTSRRTRETYPAKPNTPCDEWTGWLTPLGYGSVWCPIRKRTILAHKKAWEDAYGPVAPGIKVCHSCDNPACRRLDHLWTGTQADNLEDMRLKGRANRGLGGRPFRFTVEKMREIAAEAGCGMAVAKRHGIGKDSVYRWRKQFLPSPDPVIGDDR